MVRLSWDSVGSRRSLEAFVKWYVPWEKVSLLQFLVLEELLLSLSFLAKFETLRLHLEALRGFFLLV